MELDRALRSQDGDSLGESAGWSFATRPWQPVTISVIGELSGFDMEVGTGGSIHLVGEGEAFLREGDDFPDTYVKFVTCAADCTTPGNWSRVAIDSAWAAGSGMGLEQDESGTLHLIHISESPAPIPDTGHPVVRYGTCSADCAVLSNWSMATVDSATVIYDYGYFAGFTVTAGGTVHLLTLSSLGGPPDLTYATCAAQCTVAANWSRAVIPVTGYPMGWSALQADPERTASPADRARPDPDLLHLCWGLHFTGTVELRSSATQWNEGPQRFLHLRRRGPDPHGVLRP